MAKVRSRVGTSPDKDRFTLMNADGSHIKCEAIRPLEYDLCCPSRNRVWL